MNTLVHTIPLHIAESVNVVIADVLCKLDYVHAIQSFIIERETPLELKPIGFSFSKDEQVQSEVSSSSVPLRRNLSEIKSEALSRITKVEMERKFLSDSLNVVRIYFIIYTCSMVCL